MRAARLLALAVLLAGLVGACTEEPAPEFPAGTTMAELQKRGTIRIGVKFDQPGVGFRNLATGKLEGFDIEMGKLVAARLGLDGNDIRWVQTVSRDRIPFLVRDEVDIVIASFSITSEWSDVVGQAGPYYVAGQQLLVRKEETRIDGPHSLGSSLVCTVAESTSLTTMEKKWAVAELVSRSTYTECVRMLLRGEVAAVTTDDAILLGYAAQQPHKLKVVGEPFTEERYGIGYQLPDPVFCRFLTDTIATAQRDGSWAAAFDRTLGRAGVSRPPAPTPAPCPG